MNQEQQEPMLICPECGEDNWLEASVEADDLVGGEGQFSMWCWNCEEKLVVNARVENGELVLEVEV